MFYKEILLTLSKPEDDIYFLKQRAVCAARFKSLPHPPAPPNLSYSDVHSKIGPWHSQIALCKFRIVYLSPWFCHMTVWMWNLFIIVSSFLLCVQCVKEIHSTSKSTCYALFLCWTPLHYSWVNLMKLCKYCKTKRKSTRTDNEMNSKNIRILS